MLCGYGCSEKEHSNSGQGVFRAGTPVAITGI